MIEIVLFDGVNQAAGLAACRNQVIPPPRRHVDAAGQPGELLRDRIRAVEVVQQPPVEALGGQCPLNGGDIQAHWVSIRCAGIGDRRDQGPGQAMVSVTQSSSTGLSRRVAAPLAYAGWWVTGAILWFVERHDRTIRFHAAQSIAAFGIVAFLVVAVRRAGAGVAVVSACGVQPVSVGCLGDVGGRRDPVDRRPVENGDGTRVAHPCRR